ncbi:hypothetical protein ACQPVA_10575 [Clostridium butyricum]|uniref:hypothetical protein n=1 Tax=Clostridium butyricum TaxID=1492 RepID=UPI003D3324AA
MNTEKIKYKYGERNLLEEPEKYFFSQYNGSNFVKAYFQNRLNMIEKLKSSNDYKIYNDLEQYLGENRKNDIVKVKNEIISTQFLRVLLEEIINDNIKDKKKYLDILLKKYEVTKKIFSEYDNNFKAISNEYNNIENYCLLSICCCFYYKKIRNLKYLNVSIKINDMLCSRGIIIEKNNILLASIAVKEEIECINQLFLEEGFSYDIN